MAKRKKPKARKRSDKKHLIAKWNARLEKLGLRELRPGFLPRKRRAIPVLDDKGNEVEQRARLGLDGVEIPDPEETETRLAITEGEWVALADHLKLSGTARTVLGLRLLCDASRDEVRAYFLREHPEEVSDAMTAWREFSGKMPEIRAFLKPHRKDREVPAKPRYRLSD